MYTFSSLIDTSGGISCLFHSVQENAFCVAIETNDYDIRDVDSDIGIHELFAEAWHLLESTTPISEIPVSFARSIDSVLRQSNLSPVEGGSTEANFVAVASNRDSIFVCTAGICRVHLIQAGKLVHVTRDHNWANDWLPSDAISDELTFNRNPSAFTVPTRVLGHSSSPGYREPESQVWTATDEFTILICSKDYHRFREPSEYLGWFLNTDFSDIARNEEHGQGFLALFRRI